MSERQLATSFEIIQQHPTCPGREFLGWLCSRQLSTSRNVQRGKLQMVRSWQSRTHCHVLMKGSIHTTCCHVGSFMDAHGCNQSSLQYESQKFRPSCMAFNGEFGGNTRIRAYCHSNVGLLLLMFPPVPTRLAVAEEVVSAVVRADRMLITHTQERAEYGGSSGSSCYPLCPSEPSDYINNTFYYPDCQQLYLESRRCCFYFDKVSSKKNWYKIVLCSGHFCQWLVTDLHLLVYVNNVPAVGFVVGLHDFTHKLRRLFCFLFSHSYIC